MSVFTKKGRWLRGLGQFLFLTASLGLVLEGSISAVVGGSVALAVATLLTAGLLLAGVLIRHHGRQLGSPTAQGLLASDSRPPILFLRSFVEDQAAARSRRIYMWLFTQLQIRTFEEQLSDVLHNAGPFVAIGRPGEALPELGAARMYVSDDQWQDTVNDLLARSKIVVLAWAKTEGVLWEVERVLATHPPESILFVIGNAAHYHEFRKWAADRLPKPLPGTHPGTKLITFAPDWTPRPLTPHRSMAKTLRPLFEQNGMPPAKGAKLFSLGRIGIATAVALGIPTLVVGSIIFFASGGLDGWIPKREFDALRAQRDVAIAQARQGDFAAVATSLREIDHGLDPYTHKRRKGKKGYDWERTWRREVMDAAALSYPNLAQRVVSAEIELDEVERRVGHLPNEAHGDWRAALQPVLQKHLASRYYVEVAGTQSASTVRTLLRTHLGEDRVSHLELHYPSQYAGNIMRVEVTRARGRLQVVATTQSETLKSNYDGQKMRAGVNVHRNDSEETGLRKAIAELPLLSIE